MASALREILARFAIDVDTEDLEKGDKGVDSLVDKLEKLGSAMAGVFAIKGIADFVSKTVEEARALADAAVIAGQTEQEYQALSYAASQLSVSQNALAQGLKGLQASLYQATKGGKEASAAFAKLGIDLTNGVPKDTVAVLSDVADKIQALDNPAEQTALALKVFGKNGEAMLPMLKAGSAAIRKYAAQVDELGGGFGPGFMQMTEEFEKQEKVATFLWRSIRSQLLTTVMPALTRMVEKTVEAGKAFMQLNKDGAVMRGALISGFALLAMSLAPIVTQLKAMYLPLIGLLGVSLLLEDIYVWFQGGESVMGSFWDAFDKRIQQAAMIAGESFATMFSSWENLVAGFQAGLQFLGFALGIPFLELANLCAVAFAKIADSWAALLAKLKLPKVVQEALAFGGGTAQGGAEQAAREQNAQERIKWAEAYENSPEVVKFKEAVATRRQEQAAQETVQQAKAWEAAGGRMGTSDPARQGFLGNIPEVTIAAKPPSSQSNVTNITDNSKPTVNVTVPEGTPKAVAGAIGKAGSEALGTKMREKYQAPVGFESEA